MELNRNYFEIFGLPVDYRVDLTLLAERYLDVQKQVHPDRYADGTQAERRAAMQAATLVNTANLTLQDTLKRAIYMLQLKEVSLEENPELPPAFLMEQIELREELEAAAASKSSQCLAAFRQRLAKAMTGLEDRFAEALDISLEKAEATVYELQFLTKLKQEAEQLDKD
ncbi:MAG: Fe-S protein assembly co-chaperone HscB [Pseudomonadales bacterium]